MTDVKGADIYSKNPLILGANQPNSKVLFNSHSGVYCNIDAVGTRIWNLLDEPKTLSEIVSGLQAAYAVDREQCEQETLAFLAKLADSGFVETIGAK